MQWISTNTLAGRKGYLLFRAGRLILGAKTGVQGGDEPVVSWVRAHARPDDGLAAVAIENVDAGRCPVIPSPTAGSMGIPPNSPEFAGCDLPRGWHHGVDTGSVGITHGRHHVHLAIMTEASGAGSKCVRMKQQNVW
ncbi:hypothetical protein HGRIS_011994 [Hohenbuehelia grisea]|uniref:Uncharacterized protein n=1 Tax=Hohenbuehelia grisea TaxID=104357 RepID=A0ABR3JYU7_9AGAR